MTRRIRTRDARALTLALGLTLLAAGAHADEAARTDELEGLKSQMQILIQQNREMKQTISGLEDQVQAARDEARSAEDMARQASLPPVSQPYRDGALASRQAGSMTFQLLDVSLDVLSSFGSSTAKDDELLRLQGGEHDPRQVGGLDYWIICDDRHAYLFLTSLNGKMWRLRTDLEDFPKGFGDCQLALQAKIFEASHTYQLKGLDKYVTIIEEMGPVHFHKPATKPFPPRPKPRKETEGEKGR